MRRIYIVWILAAIAITGLVVFSVTRHKQTATTPTGCVAHAFSTGSSGTCVKDIQTMVDYMETAGLNGCPFVGKSTLAINGAYDSATKQQVKSAQAWVNCYNKEEGSSTRLPTTGSVGASTWGLLCTYAYRYPSQLHAGTSPYLKAAIAAGKSAGCR